MAIYGQAVYRAPKSTLITPEIKYVVYGFICTQIIQSGCLTNKLFPKLNVYNCRLLPSLELASSETCIISSSSMLAVPYRGVDGAELFIIWLNSSSFMVNFFDYSRDHVRKKCPSTKSNGDKGIQPIWKCHLAPSGKGKKKGLSSSLNSAYG